MMGIAILTAGVVCVAVAPLAYRYPDLISLPVMQRRRVDKDAVGRVVCRWLLITGCALLLLFAAGALSGADMNNPIFVVATFVIVLAGVGVMIAKTEKYGED